MSIDGCDRTFDELASQVLPSYMEGMRERMTSPTPLSDFATKGRGVSALKKQLGLEEDPRGCYVLMEDAKPVYVGISKHLIARLMEHVRGGDHLTATLVYRIAAMKHPHGMTAANAMKDEGFLVRFEEARAYLLRLSAAFIEIENPLELYLFEAYCALELDTSFDAGGWNSFETH